MDKNKDINCQDKRLKGVVQLAKDWKSPWTGKVSVKGTVVNLVAVCDFEKLEISVPMPSAPAMFINMANEMYNKAIKLREKIFENVDYTKKGRFSLDGWDGSIIDYFELMAGAYIYSTTAIESFVNESIPDDYIYNKTRNDKKCTESYNKDQIERYLSLDEKISDILPQIFDIKLPKGKRLYQNYIHARQIRDRIIHMKSRDRKSGEKETIWNDLLNKTQSNPTSVTIELIKHFHPNNNYPRWLQLIL